MLAGRAVAHSAAEIEIEVIRLGEFKNAFIVASPLELDAGTFKDDFAHAA